LATGAHCEFVRIVSNGNEEGDAASAEVKWYSGGGAHSAIVPLDNVEPVLSQACEERTAVMWGLEKPPQQFVEAALHSLMDAGFLMCAGLNIARLQYDRSERWWKRDEPSADPSGATVATSAHAWDGCVVAFSSPQCFHLEFRLKSRGGATILLHERDAAYTEQTRTVAPAMNLARVILNLFAAAEARYCCFPVADPWLVDEDWRSLLRPPYYPDFFLLPETESLSDLPAGFRTGRLMVTALPVKFAPHDQLAEPSERDHRLNGLRKCQALGEKCYDQMYETRLGTTRLYSSAKDAFRDAISEAEGLGLMDEARALEKRLEHVKAVFRSQFS
ncbi:MAG TPA: hypothetical protein VI488_19870, partial [Candidatus Angelobacter sp.]